MATEINVPIRLKVLQDSINEFQKILDNLQPNTKNWKDLSRIISQMTSESQKLQAQLSTPFSSQKQFSQTEKTIDKLEEAAARVQVVMSALKFSDIQLTPAQSDQLKAFNDEINTIRDSYKKLQEETKQKLLSNSNNSSLLGAIPKKDVLAKDFDGIKSAVDQHVKDLERSVENQKKQFERLRSNIELGEKATVLTTSGKGLTREALGDSIFDKYLSETEKGLRIKSWNNGITKKALLTELEKMFSLSPGELQSLAEKTIDEINKAFQEMGKKGNFNPFSGIISRGKNDKKNEPIFNSAAIQIQEQLKQYQALQAEIDKLKSTEVDPVSSVNTAKIDELTGKMNTLRASIIANVASNNNYKSSMQDFSAGLKQARTDLQETNAEFLKMQAAVRSFDALKMTITNFLGFYQILNLTKRAIQEAANHIKELDTVMNKISIVTDMDTSDLWGQIDQYSSMAQRYGTTIKGAYEVSQIYYQQGLETADVLTLTNETLKLAKISGLDYASTTDYMTTAIRGFKMEMQEAATVVDVYSALAANTAVSQEELAVAMSKTASSMESVGSTFQETSAMIATMVAVTRESATNIGSAMKSIASRYGELTKDPSKLVDSEGEVMSFNKVDAALQSVGISMKTAEGQFREFTDVIVELGEKWSELDSVQQRYIATQFAGNRQQSRFLALVSNIDLLKQNIEVAENSEDVGTVQALKALDSLESKIEQVRVAYQQFYTTVGIESVWKGFLDGARSVIDTLNGMPKLFGKIPIAAINAISIVVSLIKNLALRGLAFVSRELMPSLAAGLKSGEPQMQKAGESLFEKLNQAFLGKYAVASAAGQQMAQAYAKGVESGLINKSVNITQGQYDSWMNMAMTGKLGTGSGLFGIAQDRQKLIDSVQSSGLLTESGMNILKTGSQEQIIQFFTTLQGAIAQTGATAQSASSGIAAWSAAHQTALGNIMGVTQAVQLLALAIPTATKEGKQMSGALQAISGAGIAVVSVIKAIGAASATGKIAMPWMAIASGIVAVISGITQFLQANSIETRLEEVTKKAQNLSDEAKKLKADFNTLDTSIKKINELEKARYDSAKAAEEYQTAVDKLAETYPELVASYDLNNQAVLNVNAMEEMLAKARDESAAATLRAAQAEAEKAKTEKEAAINKLHTENNDLEKYTMFGVLGGLADVNLSEKRKLYRHQVVGKGAADLTTENLEELYDFIDIIKNAGEQHQTDKIIETYQKLNEYLVSKNINLDSDLTDALTKAVNAAYTVKGYDNVIESANRTSVSAFMNSYYGNSDSISAFKDNSGLLAAATDELYNNIQNGHYDTVTLTQTANEIFAGIDSLYTGISDDRRKEIDTILSNPSHYSQSDIQTLIPELADTKWINDYFGRQIKYNKEQLTQKIDQLKTNRQLYYNKKLDESLTLSSTQIGQFESAVGDNITLDLRNLMTSGINQAQNLKKTGQNPQEFINYFTEFYQKVSTLPAILRNSLIEQFSANGFTKEGLTETLDWINNNEDIKEQRVDFSSLENMAKSFVPNVSLTVASLEDQLTGNLDNIESLFSDLQSGIKGSKLGKTIAKAKELGIDLERTDFEEDGDKFLLNYDKLKTIVTNLHDIYTNSIPSADKFAEAYGKISYIDTDLDETVYNFDNIEALQMVLGAKYHDYFDVNDKLISGIAVEDVYQAIDTSYVQTHAALTQYENWLKIVEEHLVKTAAWKAGDYSSLEGKYATQTGEGENLKKFNSAYERIQYLAAHPEDYTEDELKEADLSNTIEIYQKGIKSLLTDLSKYGANYLTNRGNQYEGVTAETVSDIQKLANEKGSVAAIREYGEQAEMSISEINNAIIEAVTPGRAKSLTSMIGKSTTLSDLAKYAETYKIGEGKVEQFLTEDGKLGGELGKLYDLDTLTGELKLKSTSTTFDQVLAAYKADLQLEEDITGDLRNQLYQAWIASIISEEDKNDAGKQMASAISSLSSAKVGTRVDLSKSPELAEKLGMIYEVTSEAARDAMLLALDASEFDDAEARAAIISAQSTIRSKQASRTNINTLLSSNISQDTARNYIAAITDVDASLVDDKTLEGYMKNRGYVWSAIKQEFIATEDALSWYDEQIAAATGTPEEKAVLQEKRNQIEQELHKNHANEAILNVLSNAEDAADALTTFQAWFPDIDINDFTTTDNEGKRKVDIEKLKEAVGTDYEKLFDNYINQIADEYINNAQKASSLMTQGTTSKTEMDAFQKAYEKVMGEGSVAKFVYDAVTHTMVLDPAQLRSYLAGIAAKKEFGLTPEQQKDWVDSQIKALTTDNLDFSKVLDGSTTEEDTKSLKRNLEQYIKTHLPDEYKLWPEADQKEFIEGYADRIIADVEQGGQVAIDAIKSTGKELSTEEIEAAYRAQVAPIKAVADSLNELKVNSIVAKNQIEILNTAGFTVDENGVVTAVGNMVKAYKSIYDQMKATSEATTTELNDAYAQLLTAEDQRNIDITETLRNGAGMSYADFGNLLTKYNISFEEYMTKYSDTVMRDGFGNIRITDWNAFAESIWGDNLDQVKNTQEYTSAFKAYNDGLIELNKNTEEAITEEIRQITDAKAGDWLNLSELWTALEDSLASKDWTRYMGQAHDNEDDAKTLAKQAWNQSVQGQLEQWGATFENGILKLGDNVNLLGIAQTLESAAAQAGLELGNGLEEVKDTVLDILGAYTEAITNGIKGGLDNFGAQDLRNKAGNLGINNINFEQTIDGLKLSQQSAIELYQAIAKVDAIQGNIVFKELSESLKESNENFTTTSALLNHIADLTGKIQVEDGKVSSARLEQYKAELEVAKEIVAVRSAAEDDSFNFMDNKIPAGQNNPLNYAKNWTKALKTIKDAYKVKNTRDLKAGGVKRTRTGYMGYEDFYNVINEINNMAGIMKQPMTIGKTIEGDAITLDGSLTSASDAIMHGINTLTAVDTGEMMVNIGALGINLAKGGKDFENNIDAGIDAVADAQIHALDGMIAMLELIVAMEQLGDIAGEDMVIELPDIVTDNPDFDEDMDGLSDNFETWRDKFLEAGSKSRELAESITINGKNMVDWLSRAAADWTEDDAAILNALYQAAISTDWNLDDIGGSLQQMLNSGKFGELVDGFTIDIGDITYTISNGVVVEVADWSTDQAKDVLKQYQAKAGQKDATKARQEISELIQKYLNGEGATTELPVTEIIKLRHNTLIKHDKKGDYIEVTGPDGKPIRYNEGYNGFKAAIQAQVLKDQQGIDAKNVSVDYEGGTATATATYGIKNKTQFKVTTDNNGNVDWQLDPKDPLKGYVGNNRHFSTQSELLHAIYDGLQANAKAGNEQAQQLLGDSTSFESFVYAHYGIHVKVQTEVYKDGQQITDPSKDPKFRKDAKDLVQEIKDKGAEAIEEISSDGEGKTTIKTKNGYEIKLDTDDISYDGKNIDKDLLTEKLNEIIGVDGSLKDTISSAITEAFTSLSTLLTQLDSSKVTDLGTAFATVYTNVQSVAQGINALSEALAALTGIDLKINIELPDLPVPGEPGSEGATSGLTIPVGGESTGSTAEAVEKEMNSAEEVINNKAPEVNNGIVAALSETDGIKNAARAAANAIPEEFNSTLGIASPSAVMIEQAKFVGEGIEQGLNESQPIVEAAAEELGNVIIAKIEETVTKVQESIGKIIEAVEQLKNTKLDIDVDTILTKINNVQTAIDKLKESNPKIQVDTSEAESKIQALKNAAKDFTTTQHISPDGEPIAGPSDFDTTQHILHDGAAISGPSEFTTIQHIKTVGGRGGGCFVAGTQISMANGTIKNIEDIVVGDLVVAYNYQYNQFVTGRINKAYVHHNTPKLMRVSFSDGRTITLTPGHPLLSTKGWKSRDLANSLYEHKTIATRLEVGDIIIGLNGTSVVINIEDIEVPENYDTYNAEVETYHTFIANGLVAHNAKVTPPEATGNVGLAKAKGTLMGELGPELVVSNGRYFVAGQNGAEMVDLADDAIVFNHLQTEQLLKKGMSNSRGKAVTSEKNAVAFAAGNTGPAMASASAALAALKQLRAMWESLKGASISDLAGAGGGGGGGGGGGDKSKVVDPSIWVDTVERWYNLMQKIAQLEKEITHEETLRSKLQSDWNANGNHYYASQKRSLEALRDQIDAQERLNLSRQAYYDQRVEALEKSPFGKLISFNNEGQMFFQKGAMEWLTDLAGFDSYGKANYTDEEKYNRLIAAGYGDYMKYNDGGEIKMDGDNDGKVTDEERQSFYSDATKAFWDRIDEYKEATQSLWDSIKEGEDDLLKLQADQNDLFEEIRDNQMEVEDTVLDAIVDMRQREIDALQDERDKLEESTQKYIDGLTDALNNERQMYENQETDNSLNQQKRRLAILQRSGGSAQDIANLRSEIDSSERDRYFNLQQQQIDAIQAASDLEIERMDSQIEIMTETLEYQKEYGLLWGNVYAVMQESSEKIVSFITNGNSEFWASSELASKKAINEQLFAAQQWTSYRKDLAEAKKNTGAEGIAGDISKDVALMVTMTREQMKDNDYRIFDEAMKKEFGNDYDKNGTYRDIFYSEYQEHGDLTKVSASARAKYAADKAAAEAAKKIAEQTTAAAPTAAVSTPGDSGGGEGSGSNNGNSGGNPKKSIEPAKLEGKVQSIAELITGSNNPKDVIAAGQGPLNTNKEWVVTDTAVTNVKTGTSFATPKTTTTPTVVSTSASKSLFSAAQNRLDLPNVGSVKTADSSAKTNTSNKPLTSIATTFGNAVKTGLDWLKKLAGNKASGGYVNHGIYELGERGTETVLTASQTKVLRDNILSNRPNSLISLLKSYNEGYDGINNSVNGVTPIEDNSTVIEKVELNMEVKQIANDYDAKRAGEQALNEMMRIARKTGATNSIRR